MLHDDVIEGRRSMFRLLWNFVDDGALFFGNNNAFSTFYFIRLPNNNNPKSSEGRFAQWDVYYYSIYLEIYYKH